MSHQLTPQQLAALTLSCFGKIGTKRWRLLENHFSNLALAVQATEVQLIKAGLDQKIAHEFIIWRTNFSVASVIEKLAAEKISFITWHHSNYPPQLKNITDSPPILYYQGRIDQLIKLEGEDCLSVIGARKHSAYGAQVIKSIIVPTAKSGIHIISGLAAGIDALAHLSALRVGGYTVAVLGSGLSSKQIYPKNNQPLANDILANGGALISEFPPDTPPLKTNFPRRNRLIAGLSKATIVIEAAEKSGSLITAEQAKSEGRKILAVPGSIFSTFSQGANYLVKNGAQPIIEFNDIAKIFSSNIAGDDLIAIPKKCPASSALNQKNTNEQHVYNIIKRSSDLGELISADQIIRQTRLDTATINSTLSILELSGKIRAQGLGYELNIVI